jgi:hypothetical protein
LLDILYKNLLDKEKQRFLNRVRSLQDDQAVDKIVAYAGMLGEAKKHADSQA